MISIQKVSQAWTSFAQVAPQAVQAPGSEADYDELRDFLDQISDEIQRRGETIDSSPLGTLFDLVASKMHTWEEMHLEIPDAPPHAVLAFLMQERAVNQSELAQESGVTQSTISRILDGAHISASNAKKLAQYFGVQVETFL
jgi:HTH-type transcriptional regulator / antitoxin HigA